MYKKQRTPAPDESWRGRTREQRFLEKVDQSSECWNWLGGRNQNGYGLFQGWVAHRLAYAWYVGGLDPDLVVHHECMNTSCVNPEHLRQITQNENLRLSYCGNIGAARQLAKTQCPRGHEYTPENTVTHRGSRSCRACRVDAMAAHRERRKVSA